MQEITHALVGLTLTYVLGLDFIVGFFSAILPDIDILSNLSFFNTIFGTHRGFTHSLLPLLIITFFLCNFKNKRVGVSFFIGYSSHLILDSFTKIGIPLFFPLKTYYSFNLGTSSDPNLNYFFIFLSIFLLLNKKTIEKAIMNLGPTKTRFAVYSIICLTFITLAFYGGIYYQETTIDNLLKNNEEVYVSIEGIVCSAPKYHTTKYVNTFEIFSICDEKNKSLIVWRFLNKNDNKVNLYDKVKIEGMFTKAYKWPEITYVKNVEIIENNSVKNKEM